MRRWKLLCAGVIGLLAGACASSGPPPLDLSGTRVEVPPIPKWAELRTLLKPDRYDNLHEALERYRVAALQGLEHGEEPMLLAYQAFEVADPALLKELDAWVRARPRSWHAHAARAFCHLEFAYKARGTGWGNELTVAQIDGLRKYHKAAAADARKALDLQPDNIAAWHVLLVIARYNTSVEFEPATADALKAFPASYTLRFDTVWSLQPRWKGKEGDYSRLDSFVKESQAHATDNPRLRRLLAMPYWARGADRAKDRDYAGAIGLYNAALAIAEDGVYLRWRAVAHAARAEFGKAFDDARRYAELVPPTGDDTAVPEMTDSILATARALVTGNLYLGRVRPALAASDAALQHAPGDSALHFLRALARCRTGDVAGALEDFGLARDGAEDVSLLDSLRAACASSDGDPVEAIRRAQSRLLLAPGNGNVLYEVGTLYALVADMSSATAAYRAACSLDVDAACERIEGQGGASRWMPEQMRQALRARLALHKQEQSRDQDEHAAFLAALERSGDFPVGGPSPVFVKRALPDFPMWARSAHAGSVTLLIYFNKDGTVAGAKVESSEPPGYFELAALRAVLRWRIEPRKTGLKARQRLDFKLPPDKPIDPTQGVLVASARTRAPQP